MGREEVFLQVSEIAKGSKLEESYYLHGSLRTNLFFALSVILRSMVYVITGLSRIIFP